MRIYIYTKKERKTYTCIYTVLKYKQAVEADTRYYTDRQTDRYMLDIFEIIA